MKTENLNSDQADVMGCKKGAAVREIKFRCYQGHNSNQKGWRGLKYTRKMIQWEELSYKTSMYDFLKVLSHDKSLDRIIMQYTGMKDKNGKEIYEGDIISFTRPVGNWTGKTMTSIHKIYFEEHICAFVMDTIGNYTKMRNGRTYVYEVLGNIYENAGLLAV